MCKNNDHRPVFERLISKVGHASTRNGGHEPIIISVRHDDELVYQTTVVGMVSTRSYLRFMVENPWIGCNTAKLFEISDVLRIWNGPKEVTFERPSADDIDSLEELITTNYLEYTNHSTGFTVHFPPHYSDFFKKGEQENDD